MRILCNKKYAKFPYPHSIGLEFRNLKKFTQKLVIFPERQTAA